MTIVQKVTKCDYGDEGMGLDEEASQPSQTSTACAGLALCDDLSI